MGRGGCCGALFFFAGSRTLGLWHFVLVWGKGVSSFSTLKAREKLEAGKPPDLDFDHVTLQNYRSLIGYTFYPSTALVAQLVARRSDKAKVIGSSPVESTFPVCMCA